MTTRQKKIGLTALAGVSLSVALAGCATDATAESDAGAAAPAETPAASSAATPAATSSASSGDSAGSSSGSTYKDGTYEATGSYTSPNGQEEIDVSLTLAGDVITAVTVTPEATNPNSVNYQNQFADGIAQVVVGKDIDEIEVSRVAGSSLTSGGFNKAVETIKADAA
ncbi:hypothetical protein NVV95_13785 [Herbiconiux sp. CPCC 205716]|uniref:FMN-binding domain-containing protein n=2 Tax=Herbiconiux gentiana TaxID=2970912 RepID=A0ABT2GHB7_9MICO|nr:hypothetical protein [Herbiconiux gentiana]MCS5715618.1 hypothetical protein [Herbiconiux gentiana]